MNSNKGVVVLEGQVKSDAEKQLAVEVANKASDVEQVINNLKVSD